MNYSISPLLLCNDKELVETYLYYMRAIALVSRDFEQKAEE